MDIRDRQTLNSIDSSLQSIAKSLKTIENYSIEESEKNKKAKQKKRDSLRKLF